MRKVFLNIVLIGLAFALSTCKKRTSIDVQIYNFALDELITNATVVLVFFIQSKRTFECHH